MHTYNITYTNCKGKEQSFDFQLDTHLDVFKHIWDVYAIRRDKVIKLKSKGYKCHNF